MNYYLILGVDQGAGQDELRRAYLNKVRLVHPDVNPSENAAREFILLREAYETLSDENKRAVYDMKLKQAATTQQNIKNFHYDFQSNLGAARPKDAPTPGKIKLVITLAILLLLLGGMIFMVWK